jgi:hypothetical protein
MVLIRCLAHFGRRAAETPVMKVMIFKVDCYLLESLVLCKDRDGLSLSVWRRTHQQDCNRGGMALP